MSVHVEKIITYTCDHCGERITGEPIILSLPARHNLGEEGVVYDNYVWHICSDCTDSVAAHLNQKCPIESSEYCYEPSLSLLKKAMWEEK